jgi:hypothetical protein
MDVASERVVALYVDKRGPYPELLGAEQCWDQQRDARLYAGPWPVVAHPPCGPWGKLARWSKFQPADCGLIAFDQVRRFGGVLGATRGFEVVSAMRCASSRGASR